MSHIFEIENIGTTPLIIIVAILLGCLLLGVYLWKKRFDSKASAFLGMVVLAIAAAPISYFGVAGFSNNVEISSEGLTLNVPNLWAYDPTERDKFKGNSHYWWLGWRRIQFFLSY